MLFYAFAGKRFEQYLPLVIGPVMKTAGIKPEVVLVDNEAMEDIGNDVDWQFVSLGEQKNFGIRTAGKSYKHLFVFSHHLFQGFRIVLKCAFALLLIG